MTLKIYEQNPLDSSYEEKSNTQSYSSPIVLSPNGDLGDIIEKKLFILNDDASKYYVSVSVAGTPLDLISRGNPNYPYAPFRMKVLYQEDQPTETEWAGVEAGNTASVGNIGSTGAPDNGYHGFWMRLETPANLRAGENRSVSARLSFEELTV